MKKVSLVGFTILGLFGGLLLSNVTDAKAISHVSVHTSPHISVHSTPHVSSHSTFRSPTRSGSSIKSGSTYHGSVKSAPKVAAPKSSSTVSKSTTTVKPKSNFTGKPVKNYSNSKLEKHSSNSLNYNQTNYAPPYSSSFSSPRFWMWYWMFHHSDYKDKNGKIHERSKLNENKIFIVIAVIAVTILFSLIVGALILI